MFDSEEAVAVVMDELEESIVVEDGEGVVVGRMRIELGITLLDSTMVGDPDTVKVDVMLLELVGGTDMLVLVEVVIDVVTLDEIVEVDVSLVLESALFVAVRVLSELVSEAILVSDAEETALFAVEDVEAGGDDSWAEDVEVVVDVESLPNDTAATTRSPVLEALAETPGVTAWLAAMVAEDSKSSAVVVLEIGDAEGDFEDDIEDDVGIDKSVTLPLMDLSVDIVVGTEVAVLEGLTAKELVDDRDKLNVVEKVVLFRVAVEELVAMDADNDESANILVKSTTVVNELMVEVAIVVSLSLAETVLSNVEVDMSVVNVVGWLFDGDLGGKVEFRQAERLYKHWVTTFVQQKPYCELL